MEQRICVGVIVAAHGVRGLVKVRSFTARPEAIAGYGPLTDEQNLRRIALELLSQHDGLWLARIDGVSDRTAAEALRGLRLYAARSMLPETDDDEYYHADLIGLVAETANGDVLGVVTAVHDFGGGPSLEIKADIGRATLVPFTRLTVPVVDLGGRRIVVDPPLEI